MKSLNKQGFSMIELLVVLLIIAVLAAVAAPLFFNNSAKAKLSEAVAGAGSIRSAERTYYSQNSSYYSVNSSETVYFGTGGSKSADLGVTMHGNKYFSPASYTVTVGGSWTSTPTGFQPAQDFLITVNGTNSVSLATDATDGAANAGDVGSYMVEMDNAGQTIYSIGGTAGPWQKY